MAPPILYTLLAFTYIDVIYTKSCRYVMGFDGLIRGVTQSTKWYFCGRILYFNDLDI